MAAPSRIEAQSNVWPFTRSASFESACSHLSNASYVEEWLAATDSTVQRQTATLARQRATVACATPAKLSGSDKENTLLLIDDYLNSAKLVSHPGGAQSMRTVFNFDALAQLRAAVCAPGHVSVHVELWDGASNKNAEQGYVFASGIVAGQQTFHWTPLTWADADLYYKWDGFVTVNAIAFAHGKTFSISNQRIDASPTSGSGKACPTILPLTPIR